MCGAVARRIRDGRTEQANEDDWETLKLMLAEFWRRVQEKLPSRETTSA